MTAAALRDLVAARVRALEGEGTGDAVGLALVGTLLERAQELPANGRDRLLARAEALLARYQTRAAITERRAPTRDDRWRETLEARARARAPRVRREPGSATLVAEIRATTATARAAAQVPEAAGPYNGAAVASRALEELAALAPGYVSSYVAWLEDLATLAELPDRRAPRRKT